MCKPWEQRHSSAGSRSLEELRWALLVLAGRAAPGTRRFPKLLSSLPACGKPLQPDSPAYWGSLRWELLVPPASSKPHSPDHKMEFKVKSTVSLPS